MMKSTFFSFLLYVMLLGNTEVIASGGFVKHTTHTLELKPTSFSRQDLKLASICFLGVGDCDPNAGFNGGDDYTIDTENQCLNEGFIKLECNSTQQGDGICPHNPNYGKSCKCKSGLITCPQGQVGIGESCEGKYENCKCNPSLISCAHNQNGSGALCGGRYESCACKPEYQYNSSNCSSPRSVSGNTCGSNYTNCTCPSGVSTGAYGCKNYYSSPCSSICREAYGDNCHNRTSVQTPYGCMNYFADCASACERAYPDNCRNRTAVATPYGCIKYFADCSSACEQAYSDNCRNRSAVTTPYGCQSAWSDCPSKCQIANGNPDCNVNSQTCAHGCSTTNSCNKCTSCKTDNCAAYTAINIPTNASCSTYFSDCPTKCSDWSCNTGFQKMYLITGWGCTDRATILVQELTNGRCSNGPFSTITYKVSTNAPTHNFPMGRCASSDSIRTIEQSLQIGSIVTIQAKPEWDYSGANTLCKITETSPYTPNLIQNYDRNYTFTVRANTSYYILWDKSGKYPCP